MEPYSFVYRGTVVTRTRDADKMLTCAIGQVLASCNWSIHVRNVTYRTTI